MWRYLILSLLLLAGMADDPPATTSAPVEQRVILIVNRNKELPGYLVSETDQEIVIRTRQGEVQTHPRTRVLHVVRLVDPAPGQTGLVILRTGETRDGIIIEDNFDFVLMEIKGIRARLSRESVSHVVLEASFEEKYEQAKAAIAPENHEGLLVLCRWLMDEQRYDLARTELLSLLEKTEMPEARKLLTTVEAQLALEKPRETADDTATSQPNDGENPEEPHKRTGPVYPADILPGTILTSDDVNIIRVYEIDFDRPPKVVVPADTIRALIENYGTTKLIPASQTGRTAMFRADPLDIVRVMFELRARELYPQIEVKTEPYALNLFRQRVHDTWLMNNCASTRCHGGVEGAPFFLHARNYKDDRVRYTNLLILERLQLDPAWPLINYDKPDDSLILQYGLPRESARKPHPKVPNWKPAFTDTQHKLWQGSIEWIRAMMVPRPAYPVEYEPPKLERAVPVNADASTGGGRQPR